MGNPFVGLVQALAWPVALLILLLSFWRPLHQIADFGPLLMQRLISDTVGFSIGTTTFQLQRRLVDRASPELKATLAQLAPEDIRVVLDTPFDNEVSWPERPSSDDPVFLRYKHLEGLGLVREMTQVELDRQTAQGHPSKYGVKPVLPYGQVRDFLIATVLDVIEQAKALPVITKVGVSKDPPGR